MAHFVKQMTHDGAHIDRSHHIVKYFRWISAVIRRHNRSDLRKDMLDRFAAGVHQASFPHKETKYSRTSAMSSVACWMRNKARSAECRNVRPGTGNRLRGESGGRR